MKKNFVKKVEPMKYLINNNNPEKEEITYLIGFTDENDIPQILKDLDNSTRSYEYPDIGGDIEEDLQWYKDNNKPWTGWSNVYPFRLKRKSGRESTLMIGVIFINFEKIFRFSKENGKQSFPFLMNILTHEVRHIVDAMMLYENGELPKEVEESPAKTTGQIIEHLMEPIIRYFTQVKDAKK